MLSSLHQSHMGMWSRCPEQFRRRYMEGEIMPPGIAARIGTGLHKGAEVGNLAKMAGKEEPKDVVIDAAVDGYKKACRDGVFFSPEEAPSAPRQINDGVDTTAKLAGLLHHSVLPKINPVAVEEHLVLDAGLGIPFVGTVDWRDADPNRWGDFKTAARAWSTGKADSEIQPTLYPRLIEAHTGVLPTELEYHILTKTKEPKHQIVKTRRTDDDWRILLLRARMMLRQIAAGIFPPAGPGHWICSSKWCGYFWSCPHIPDWKKVLPKKTE